MVCWHKWSKKWSKPYRVDYDVYDDFGEPHSTDQMVQTKVCKKCGKVKVRVVHKGHQSKYDN